MPICRLVDCPIASFNVTRRASTVCLNSQSNTGAGVFDVHKFLTHCSNCWPFAGFVLLMCQSDLHGAFTGCQYIYDLSFPNGALLAMDFTWSLSHLKHGIDNTNFQDSILQSLDNVLLCFARASLLDEFPGGNQVDGLPPVAHSRNRVL